MNTDAPDKAEPLSHDDKVGLAEFVAAATLRAIELAPFVLIGLLVCPPLAILAVLLAISLLVTVLLLGVLAVPYLIVTRLLGHHRHAELLKHRLRHAGRALLDLAPHRIAADARRLHRAT